MIFGLVSRPYLKKSLTCYLPRCINHEFSDYNPQQSIAKIRLFCSTCSQEFATSNELNKHMEKHNLELNSACSSNYLEPHTNNSNKRAFDYEHANSAMNYKVAEEELVVSIKVIIYKGVSHISFSKQFFYFKNQLDPSTSDSFNLIIDT